MHQPLTPLTRRQASILRFIESHIADRGYPPSVREVGEQFDIVSPNGVMCHFHALEAKGVIERDHNISRGIRVL